MRINQSIEKEAQKLLDKFDLNNIPVQVEDVAKKLNLNLLPFDLGTDVSGVLHIENDKASIGYNPLESKVRQRFTIAHELGHFVLHRDKGNVFVDNENYYSQIKFRSSNLQLSSEDHQQEREANEFAAALLMPVNNIKKEIKKLNGFDLSDSSMIMELAKKYEVSIPAMTFRIINLSESDLI
jgi:Zn-dependent peptidase ImmA (M78 family)